MTCKECDNPIHARGLCSKHYARVLRTVGFPPKPKKCIECREPVEARGLCKKHYMRVYRAEAFTPRQYGVRLSEGKAFDTNEFWEFVKKEMGK